jgi:hypothetical protein
MCQSVYSNTHETDLADFEFDPNVHMGLRTKILRTFYGFVGLIHNTTYLTLRIYDNWPKVTSNAYNFLILVEPIRNSTIPRKFRKDWLFRATNSHLLTLSLRLKTEYIIHFITQCMF